MTRERYGDNPFGQGCLLARRLIEHDVRAVEVGYGGWDMHNNVFVAAPERCDVLDQGMSALIDDLERRGKLEDTLIVLTTEFGRTPRINQNAGRDHYPKAFSSVLAGGGIKGGIAYGKTDEGGENVIENPVKIQDFNATVAYALGLPLDQVLYSPSKRPFTVAHKGEPVLDLFA
jgi:arylsulfatase A-like enzyme